MAGPISAEHGRPSKVRSQRPLCMVAANLTAPFTTSPALHYERAELKERHIGQGRVAVNTDQIAITSDGDRTDVTRAGRVIRLP